MGKAKYLQYRQRSQSSLNEWIKRVSAWNTTTQSKDLPNKILSFLNKNSITVLLITTWINSKHSSTPKNFIYGMDKNYVLRFEDCIYDFNKKASRPGRPSNFCLKSTNHLIYFYSGINSLHIEIHMHVDIF